MALALAELDKVANPVICEVGRLRNVHTGESDGHSTLAFLEYVNGRDGKLVSIDDDLKTESICRRLFVDSGISDIKRIVFDNWSALEKYHHPNMLMDLLYLDAWDLHVNKSAENHLICFMWMEMFVKPGGLVLIDDTGYPDLGKGKLVVPVAGMMGWTVLHQGFQTLLRKP
jgi:predicted O-methyltransferase YrrM